MAENNLESTVNNGEDNSAEKLRQRAEVLTRKQWSLKQKALTAIVPGYSFFTRSHRDYSYLDDYITIFETVGGVSVVLSLFYGNYFFLTSMAAYVARTAAVLDLGYVADYKANLHMAYKEAQKANPERTNRN
ncbi:MAG: hypothetical protein HY363_04595 [Candidatus Aenigmarchaeota archaeon]|nr:hypothetical protein [Candidatus Aenigmarchaeota archaeon]